MRKKCQRVDRVVREAEAVREAAVDRVDQTVVADVLMVPADLIGLNVLNSDSISSCPLVAF